MLQVALYCILVLCACPRERATYLTLPSTAHTERERAGKSGPVSLSERTAGTASRSHSHPSSAQRCCFLSPSAKRGTTILRRISHVHITSIASRGGWFDQEGSLARGGKRTAQSKPGVSARPCSGASQYYYWQFLCALSGACTSKHAPLHIRSRTLDETRPKRPPSGTGLPSDVPERLGDVSPLISVLLGGASQPYHGVQQLLCSLLAALLPLRHEKTLAICTWIRGVAACLPTTQRRGRGDMDASLDEVACALQRRGRHRRPVSGASRPSSQRPDIHGDTHELTWAG